MAWLLSRQLGWHSALSDSGDPQERPPASPPPREELGFLTAPQRVAETGQAGPVAWLWACAVTQAAQHPLTPLWARPAQPLVEGLLPASADKAPLFPLEAQAVLPRWPCLCCGTALDTGMGTVEL